ncbi:uncharacterized protein B0I36DRAFT_373162 [Microdochium trichocladiopsis]|uniref:DUF7082 domain-containing protein n=1 Tax=Microdochium trichocladiopsis TaxID=1682393 RepID=A0A9P9BTC9_9PEZI|nr:uncharacterized protein B0I36DRAFT_373162 [Microdochium trichocladiopsis]KAH7035820.1 hypothetical protein B0I36DRAFT_373162 [Microdochium trichocladiopsis]
MSDGKFDFSTYKLFEPQYQPDRLIIVDADSIESPETVTLRYEEEAAARANGGDRRGESPTGLLSMAAYAKPQLPQMHSFDSARTYQDTQYQYPPHQFHGAQADNAASQLSHMAFAENSAAAPYIGHVALPTVISCVPSSGAAGTKINVKISALYDLLEVTSHFYLAFGDHRVPAHAIREASDGSGHLYAVSGQVPHHHLTRSDSVTVPLSLSVDSPEGHTMATVEIGTFTIEHSIGAVSSPHDDGVSHRKGSKSPGGREEHQKHGQEHVSDNSTGAFGYPHPDQQGVVGGYNGDLVHSSMAAPYQRLTYMGGEYPRIPPPLKTPSWSPYGSSLESRSPVINHTTITRPSITSLPMPTSTTPQLVRTSTLQSSGSSSTGAYGNPYALYSNKAVLKIQGDLDSMARGWTTEEWTNRRRIVLFTKQQKGSTLITNFRPVTVSERPPNSICISCIYWQEKDECYVTSVDTISLLEQLVAAPARFTVEEKNRIRRNLEGFRPATVSKAKADSEEFFKIIMAFPNPKPRNIEKDVKVFPWKILSQALKKIISKYVSPRVWKILIVSLANPVQKSASPSSTTMPTGATPALLTPISNASPGLYQTSHTPSLPENNYSAAETHPTMPSPRSLSGGASGWGGYPSSRALSPTIKPMSPQQAGIGRIPGLQPHGGGVADPRHQQQQQQAPHQYGMPPQLHGRWDAGVPGGYGAASGSGAAAYGGHQHHGQVYSGAHYVDRGHRE